MTEDLVEEEDRLVLYYRLQGKHTGEGGLVRYQPTEERWDMLGVTAFRFADGRIIEEPWAVNTVAAMLSAVAKANVRRMIEVVWSVRNADEISKYYAQDFLYHGSEGQRFQGHSAHAQMISELKAKTPDARFEAENQVSEGDRVLTRWRLVNGSRPFKTGMSLIRFADGQAQEEWAKEG